MPTDIHKLVDEKIANNAVTVFSKTYCPFCDSTKKVMAGFKVKGLMVMELDEHPDGGAIQDYLQTLTGARSVPRVFIGGKSIGGNDDVLAAKSNGELLSALQKAGAV
eukprot:Platyproteum_vivax@DN196_c0_g1_i2.p1